MSCLSFQLCGAMASWGDRSGVGDLRATGPAPTHSALVGLITAAMGVDRYDPKQSDYVRGYRFAVRLDAPGTPLRDFHTVQTLSRPAAKRVSKELRVPTRGDYVRSGESFETKVTLRTYLSGFAGLVVVTATPDAPTAVEELADHLRAPRFPIYLGRRGCPPAAPLNPTVHAASVEDVLQQHDTPDLRAFRPRHPSRLSVWWDARLGLSLEPQQTVSERSIPVNRRAWQFEEYDLNLSTIELSGEEVACT